MSLNLIFTQAGNYTIDDNDIPGDNTSVIRDSNGTVVFTFVHPADSVGFTVATSGVNMTVNMTDPLGAASFMIGSLTSPTASPESITIGGVRSNSTVALIANSAITELGSDVGVDIFASGLVLSATTGVGAASNAIETQTGAIEAETTTGGITLSNFGTVQIGGLTNEVNGLQVTTSGNINFSTVGSILLSDASGAASVSGGSVSGNVTLTANGIASDIISNVDKDAISAFGGNIALNAGRDVAFGTIGADYDNDVRARGSITINAGRDFIIDGFADLASDDVGANTGGNVGIIAGRNIHVRSVAGIDGSIFANGDAGADVILTTGAGGAVMVDPASISGAPQPIASNSGDVFLNADRILVSSASGIGALNGQITLRPVTAGREILLGDAGDSAFAMQLSDGELDRMFTPTLTIGNDLAGQMTVTSAISPANASNLVLRSGTDIAVQAGITTSGSLELRAGDNVYFSSSPVITVGGTLSIFVDTLGNDGGAGGFVNLSGATVNAASIAINGGGENDTLYGVAGSEQTVHGNGGNDTIISSGEGHYYGDAGNDTMLAGLSSGLFPEVLDGGAGIDTLDTRSFNGAYVINLATGTTNFGYESFVNFENVITGDGADQITGSSGNNSIDGGGGADTMAGGLGNDTYYVSNVNDKVIEANGAGTGIDTVFSFVTYSVVSQFVENLTLTGGVSIDATGNNLDNTLTGNGSSNTLTGLGGNDTLNGGADADTMIGGLGDDTYYVDNVGDKVTEAAGQGTDTVYSSVSMAFASQFVENITLTGTTNINTTGNSLANVIVGNSGQNALTGREGNDTLTGGLGNDSFVFNTTPNTSTNIDRITDFSNVAGNNDTIMLENAIFTALGGTGTLSSNMFWASTTGLAHDADDRIMYNTVSGNLYYDPDGTGSASNVLFAALSGHPAITNADFLVI